MTKKFLFFAAVAALLVAVEGRSAPQFNGIGQEKIVGGAIGTDGQFPYQVALFEYIFGQWTFFCGGTLLTPKFVLTAAHCMRNRLASGLRARGGEFFLDDISGHEQEITGKTRHLHPEYNFETKENDLAILELSTPFQINEFVKTIGLPTSDVQIGDEDFLRVTGWGPTVNGGLTSRRLHYLDVNVADFESCNATYPDQISEADTLCAGATSKNACASDAGGPLVFSFDASTVLGILSRPGCGEDGGFMDVYMRVSAYLPFIKDVTGL